MERIFTWNPRARAGVTRRTEGATVCGRARLHPGGALRVDARSCYFIPQMRHRALEGRLRRQQAPARLCWVLATALLLVQLLGGRGLLVHQHEDSGYHAHLLSAGIDAHSAGDWHAQEHAHAEHGAPASPAHEPAYESAHELLSLGVPHGLIVEAPRDSFAASLRPERGILVALASRMSVGIVQAALADFRPPRPPTSAARDLLVRRERTGSVLVLSTSRALRI